MISLVSTVNEHIENVLTSVEHEGVRRTGFPRPVWSHFASVSHFAMYIGCPCLCSKEIVGAVYLIHMCSFGQTRRVEGQGRHKVELCFSKGIASRNVVLCGEDGEISSIVITEVVGAKGARNVDLRKLSSWASRGNINNHLAVVVEKQIRINAPLININGITV